MVKAERLGEIRGYIGGLYGPDLHAKRVDALAGATLGVMTGASLAVAMIGQALAQARGLVTKHAVKQVDRLMSNASIDVWDSFARWVPQQVGDRPDILVAMDWTDFDHDGQSTLVLSLVTGHGRAAPLIWLTVWKEEITTRRNDYEDACLRRLAETMPVGCRVTILADRGFGDLKNPVAALMLLGFVLIIALNYRRIIGGTLIGILAVTIIGLPFGLAHYSGIVSLPPSIAPTLLQLDFSRVFEGTFLIVVFSILFIDVFDNAGTLIGVTHRTGLMKYVIVVFNMGV